MRLKFWELLVSGISDKIEGFESKCDMKFSETFSVLTYILDPKTEKKNRIELDTNNENYKTSRFIL